MSVARDAFEAMVRYEIGPALRDIGFQGTFREFRIREGNREGVIALTGGKNSGHFYDFYGKLFIRDRSMKTISYVGSGRLLGEDPGVADSHWEVRPGEPTAEIARQVVDTIREIAAPALRMDLAYPDITEYTPSWPSGKPEAERKRVMPGTVHRVVFGASGIEDVLAFSGSADWEYRNQALWRLWREFRDDPRSTEVFVHSVTDMSPAVRQMACQCLRETGRGGTDAVSALQVALLDENSWVRWQARLALILRGETALVAEIEARRRPLPEPQRKEYESPKSVEKLLASSKGADPRISPFTAARLNPGDMTRHALAPGWRATLCGLPRDQLEMLPSLFLLGAALQE